MPKPVLYDRIAQHFSLDELRELAFQLDVDFDELGGNNKNSKIKELISYMERRNQELELISFLKKSRPSFEWEMFLPTEEPRNDDSQFHNTNNDLLEEKDSFSEQRAFESDLSSVRLELSLQPHIQVGSFLRKINEQLLDFEFLYSVLSLLYIFDPDSALIRLRMLYKVDGVLLDQPNLQINSVLRLLLPATDFYLAVKKLSYGSPLLTDIAGIGKVVEVIRETLKDVQWKNKHERAIAIKEEEEKSILLDRQKIQNQREFLELRKVELDLYDQSLETAKKQINLILEISKSKLSPEQIDEIARLLTPPNRRLSGTISFNQETPNQ